MKLKPLRVLKLISEQQDAPESGAFFFVIN